MTPPPVRGRLAALDEKAASLLEAVAMILLGGLVLVIAYSVLAREAFRLSTPWAEEVATSLLVWTVMLGAASAWGRRLHITIDFLLRRIPLGPRVWLSVAIELGSLLLFWVILRGSYAMLFASANTRTSALGISFTWLYLGLLVGTVAMILFSLLHLWRLLTGGRALLAETKSDAEWTSS